MKKNVYFLSILQAAVLAVALLAVVVIRALWPQVILPPVNIPNLLALSLAALVLERYLGKNAGRNYLAVAGFAALSYFLLPLAAGCVTLADSWKLMLLGAGVFTAAAWLYTAMTERLSSGPVAKAAPVLCALLLFLAGQCFTAF